MATGGQTLSQAMQKMQAASFAGSAFFPDAGWPGVSSHSNTFSGHASMHAPSAVQRSKSTATHVPWMPSLAGFSSVPQIAWPACSPDCFKLVMKSGSIAAMYISLQDVCEIDHEFNLSNVTDSVKDGNQNT